MTDRDARTWEARLVKVVTDLRKAEEAYERLFAARKELMHHGWTEGHATQVRIAEITGLSRGRVQQLLRSMES